MRCGIIAFSTRNTKELFLQKYRKRLSEKVTVSLSKNIEGPQSQSVITNVECQMKISDPFTIMRGELAQAGGGHKCRVSA